MLRFMTVSMLWLASSTALAADTECGEQACEEAICATSDVIVCSDWNDLSFDNWSVSSGADRKGGDRGDIYPGQGLNGTAGWNHNISVGVANSVFMGQGAAIAEAEHRGPLYTRFYVKFSDNYNFNMHCGLQKMFYHTISSDGGSQTRFMLGMESWNRIEGDDVFSGVFGFDFYGHLVAIPNGESRYPEIEIVGTDNPTRILPGVWYAVEWMTEVTDTHVFVKIWVNDELQMTRRTPNEFASLPVPGSGTWLRVKNDAWYGGGDGCGQNTEEQAVFKDNHVISRSRIGMIGAGPFEADAGMPDGDADGGEDATPWAGDAGTSGAPSGTSGGCSISPARASGLSLAAAALALLTLALRRRRC